MVEPIFSPDVQIVGGNQARNHWHCIYYDGEKLHIFDSLYYEKQSYQNLTSIEKKYIKKRYPNLSEKNVIFEKVTKQPDNASCGIYAAAFAVSIAWAKIPLVKIIQKILRKCVSIV